MEKNYILHLNSYLDILLNNTLIFQKLHLLQPTTELTIWKIFGQIPNKHIKLPRILLIKESKTNF